MSNRNATAQAILSTEGSVSFGAEPSGPAAVAFLFHGTLLRVVDELLVTSPGENVRDDKGRIVGQGEDVRYTSVRVEDDPR